MCIISLLLLSCMVILSLLSDGGLRWMVEICCCLLSWKWIWFFNSVVSFLFSLFIESVMGLVIIFWWLLISFGVLICNIVCVIIGLLFGIFFVLCLICGCVVIWVSLGFGWVGCVEMCGCVDVMVCKFLLV